MTQRELKERTKRFALDVIKLVETLPKDPVSKVLSTQLLRAGTSVGANYRAACRAKSTADFISKMGTVEEEVDESEYWLDLLVSAGRLSQASASGLAQEASELTAITVSSINTARKSDTVRRSAIRNSKPEPGRSAIAFPRSAIRNPQSEING